jgi:hypothetical protein
MARSSIHSSLGATLTFLGFLALCSALHSPLVMRQVSRAALVMRAVSLVQATAPENDKLSRTSTEHHPSRRQALFAGLAAGPLLAWPLAAKARAPGSADLDASLEQIDAAAVTLKDLRAHWKEYTLIDKEGRAVDTDRARRILGEVSPQSIPSTSPLFKVHA